MSSATTSSTRGLLAHVVRAGPEVRGAAEALLMTMVGRRDVASELSGQGQRKSADRIGV